jgi:NADP-dependent aldehyde dehydrogenase
MSGQRIEEMKENPMSLTGELLIGAAAMPGTGGSFQGINPATGEAMAPRFTSAGVTEVERACALADAAFDVYRETTPEARAIFLETIADNIQALGDALIERAVAESGLPTARIAGERGRTTGQLRLFASVVRDGSWMDLRIDPAMPDRTPLPRSDLRLRMIAIGPVAVFGASNFPLAFSVAGGDTASALAAGCPVVFKGHPAHPGTSELIGRAIQQAVASCGLPEGVFSLLSGVGNALGSALVADPRICAVGFTGSRSGGLALLGIAQQRPVPIPVYAEMSSINPVLLMPGALAARGAAIGKAFAGSLTMGAGQFCTNPGLVLAIPGPGLDSFIGAASDALQAGSATTMLTKGIAQAYQSGVERVAGTAGVETVARGGNGTTATSAPAALFATDAETFLANHSLENEVFGAAALVVRCPDLATMRRVMQRTEGQLTVTLQMDAGDTDDARTLLPVLERRCGRILVNGWPTGVEVGHAMVHGGPFPSTSDARTTSVGTLAIRRFLRPVCYQDMPVELLPQALKPDSKLPRMMDGVLHSA